MSDDAQKSAQYMVADAMGLATLDDAFKPFPIMFVISRISEVFNLGGRRVLVEQITALVCVRCGEPTFSREATEQIRRMVPRG